MSLTKKIGISVAAVLVLLAGFLYVTAKKMYAPTIGERIGAYAKPGKALFVIDVQEDYTGLSGGKQPLFKHADAEIGVINKLIDAAAAAGMQVVYIRQVFENNFITRNFIGRTVEGFPGAELDQRIKVIDRNDFTKRISDAFSNPLLTDFLVARQVNELYLVGLDAAYCVHKTALGGLNRGYRVTAVTDAIMTRKDMNTVLQRYKQDGIMTASSTDLMRAWKNAGSKDNSEGYRMLPED